MIFFFVVIVIFIALFSTYVLIKPKKSIVKFLYFFFGILVPSIIIYLYIGSLESFVFKKNLEKEINTIAKNPENFKTIDPKKIIFFLESKLKENPRDITGWKLLIRTCIIMGHNQKADLYFKRALKNFPDDEELIFENAILKKNIKQFSNAMLLLEKIYKLNPENFNAIKMQLEILIDSKNKNELKKKIKKLKANTQDVDSLEKLLKNMKLDNL